MKGTKVKSMVQLQELLTKAESLFKQKNYREVIEMLPEDVLDKYHSVELYVLRARSHSGLKETEKMLPFIELAIRIDPKYALIYRTRGNYWSNLKEYDHAILDYNKALELNPQDFEVYYNRALCWHRKNFFEKAIEDYDKVLALNPQDVKTYINKGNVLSKIKQFDKALEHFDKALSLDANNAVIYFNIGLVFSKKKDYNEAVKNYSRAIKLNPKYSMAYVNRGFSFRLLKNDISALEDYNIAIKLLPDPIGYSNRGLLLKDKGQLEEALCDFEKAIELDSKYAMPYRGRGDIYYERKEYEKALADYEKAIQLEPEKYTYLTIRRDKIKEQLEEQKRLQEKLKTDVSLQERIKSLEKHIEVWASGIRELAKSNKKQVVHYTKLSVGEKLVTGLTGKLWYSNVIYMNDPDEGKILFKHFKNGKIEESFLNGARVTESSVYLGSFLSATADNIEISHEDELVMWRTYGKNEDKEEAAGCSLVIDASFFDNDGEKAETGGDKGDEVIINGDAGQTLLNVIYLKNGKIEKDSGGKIKNGLEELEKQVTDLISLKQEASEDVKSEIDKIVFKHLSNICYLFKSSDYVFENEVRVIVYVPRGSGVIQHFEQKPPLPPKRFYIESTRSILPYLRKIYLGAKVQNHAQWSYYLDYELRQKQKIDPAIKASEIEILKSTCNFQ